MFLYNRISGSPIIDIVMIWLQTKNGNGRTIVQIIQITLYYLGCFSPTLTNHTMNFQESSREFADEYLQLSLTFAKLHEKTWH